MDLKAFSFTKALKVASQASRWQDTITNLESSRLNPPKIQYEISQLTFFELRHQLYNMLEFDKNIFYFFTSITTPQSNKPAESNKGKEPIKEKEAEFELICYSFAIEDGVSTYFHLKGLKGTPSCIGSGISAYLKQRENIQNTQKVQNNYLYKMVVLIGLQEGFVKVVQFEAVIEEKKTEQKGYKKKKEQQKGGSLEKDQQKQQREQKKHQRKKKGCIEGNLTATKEGSYIKYSVFSDKLQQKPIVSITVAEKFHYEQRNVCFIMFQDNKVFIYNYVSNLVLCIYQPPILSHDHAITFTLHSSGNYFATGSRSGQINVWELTPAVLKAIAHSQDKQLKTKKKQNIEEVEVMQEQKEEYVWKFKTKDRIINVFPLTAVHAACIDGLKWISFMGNLMALVSSSGLFRLIAINMQIRDEYITIIEHQIQDGASISGIQIFPEMQCILYYKSFAYVAEKTQSEVKDKTSYNQQSTYSENSEKQYLMQNDNYYKTNLKTLKHCKAKQNIIEKLHFGEDLNISRIKKIRISEKCNQIIASKTYEATKPSVQFISGTVSYYTANQIVMCRNDNGFYIGVLIPEEE